jgi:hypothetical protein
VELAELSSGLNRDWLIIVGDLILRLQPNNFPNHPAGICINWAWILVCGGRVLELFLGRGHFGEIELVGSSREGSLI